MADKEAFDILRVLLVAHVGKRSLGDIMSIGCDPSLFFRLWPAHQRRYEMMLEAFQEITADSALPPITAGAFDAEQDQAACAEDVASPGFLPKLAAAAIFARAAYGALMRRGGGDQVQGFVGGAAKASCGIWDAAAHDDAFLELVGVPRQDLLLSSWSERTFEPAFVLFWEHRLRWLVLAVRGSSEPKSILTDIAADTCDLAGGRAHSGMVRSARWVLERVRMSLIGALQQFPDYTVVCTGHSLGADVATIVALLMREEAGTLVTVLPATEPQVDSATDPIAMQLGQVRQAAGGAVAYAFGTSPLLSPDLAERCTPFVSSVARNVDYITRLSVFGMDRLMLELTEHSVFRRAKQWLLRSTGREEMANNDKAATRNRAFGDCARVAEILSPPGRLVHMDRRGNKPPRLTWAMPGFYHEMLLSPSMFHDHLPILYVEDLLQIVTSFVGPHAEAELELTGPARLDPGAQRRVLEQLHALHSGQNSGRHKVVHVQQYCPFETVEDFIDADKQEAAANTLSVEDFIRDGTHGVRAEPCMIESAAVTSGADTF
jgi:hypothetical protein